MSRHFHKPSATLTYTFYCIIVALYLSLGPAFYRSYGPLGLAVTQIILLVLIPSLYTWIFKGPFKSIFPLKSIEFKDLLWLFVLTSIIIVALETLLYYQNLYIPFQEKELITENQGATWRSMLEQILLVAALTSLCEEFFFRGFIQYSLVKRSGKVIGIVTSSLAFALAHFDRDFFLSYFLFGIFLGMIREKKQNLTLCVIAHFSYNLYGLLP